MQAIKFSNLELLKELELSKDNQKRAKELLVEVNNRLNKKGLNFKGRENKYLYLYMLLSNRFNLTNELNTLLNDKDFIKSIDLSGIEGSIILSLTDKCSRPRKELLTNSEVISKSILKEDSLFSTKDLLADFTKEEILILRENQEIDNFLIAHGLRFDALKETTLASIEKDFEVLKNYNIDTIREFTDGCKDLKGLANNKKFISLYLSKLDNSYKENDKLFNSLTIKQVADLPELDDNAYLHLIAYANPSVQKELLKNKRVEKILINCNNLTVLNKLPKDYLVKLLIEKENLLSGINLIMLQNLNKEELTEIAKKSKHFYSDLVEKITQNDNIDYKPFITALPTDLLNDLGENKISEFNFEILKKLLNSNKKFFKESIINNQNVSNYLVNRENVNEILELLDDSDFNNEEKIRLLNNCTDVKKASNVCKIIYTIPENLRSAIYKNSYIRELVLNEKTFKLDSYTIKYLLNDLEEASSKPTPLLLDLLISSDTSYAEEILSTDLILEKIFREGSKTSPKSLGELLKTKPSLINFYQKDSIKKYYTKELLNELSEFLDVFELEKICTNEVINTIYENDETKINVYKKLKSSNNYLLNTLDFCFINDVTKELKVTILEELVKYPDIQKNILAISKKYNVTLDFINQLYYSTKELDKKTVNEILTIFRMTLKGENRKKVGNIAKMLTVVSPKEISKTNFTKLINYLLYFVPRYGVLKESIIKTPMTFNELIKYEDDFENKLTQLIAKDNNVKENFLLKHFKLNIEESISLVNHYSTKRIDEHIYHEEYKFLNSLFEILNLSDEELRERDSKYKVISMYDSFVIEEKIKNMYSKIYNYEIRSKTLANKPYIKEIFGKELKIYTCPNDFLLLVNNIDINEEYERTNSFLLGWHNTLNKLKGDLHVSLLSNDNLYLSNDITFGFNGVAENGIRDMSTYYKNRYAKFMTPRELIDNTRDLNNRLLIDKYAIHSNTSNPNMPNIEPDFILVDETRLDDNSYLEKISRASQEFKTKKNKDGIPIIAVNPERVANNEIKKIDTLFTKYKRSHDLSVLNSLVTKINNNYTAYRNYNQELKQKFNIVVILEEVKNRIKESNSISEIEYIEDIFVDEETKYKYIAKELTYEKYIQELKTTIDNRLKEINKGE